MIKRDGRLGPGIGVKWIGRRGNGSGAKIYHGLTTAGAERGVDAEESDPKLRYSVSSSTIAHRGSFICRESDAKSHPATRLPTRIICRQINPPLNPPPPPATKTPPITIVDRLDQWCETWTLPKTFLFKLYADNSGRQKQKINIDMLTLIYGNDQN